MANEEHLAILKRGVRAWNEWRKQHPDIRPNLSGANLTGANLNQEEARPADLSGVHLRTADLHGADLFGARLRGADLSGAELSGGDLSGADLVEADLSQANLTAANLDGAQLLWANLSGAHLWGADLSGADLVEANLIGAELSGAHLWGADLGAADLSRADLRQANLTAAKFRETDFSEARLGWTVLANVDLSTVNGLDTVQHVGPSTIGVDTIYNSQGKIPEVFLRGAGLPDKFIEYVHSLVYSGIQFYSCFISYSGRDQEFADRLHEGLQNKGVRCWFAPHDVKAGEKLHEQIDAAIRLHDKLLLILSEHSMNSEWVKTEIAKARKRELKEGKRVLFPVRLVEFETLRDWECFDGDTGKDSAREIREYFIPDFANWKDHDSYQKGFDRLLKDLKSPDAEAKSVAPAKD